MDRLFTQVKTLTYITPCSKNALLHYNVWRRRSLALHRVAKTLIYITSCGKDAHLRYDV